MKLYGFICLILLCCNPTGACVWDCWSDCQDLVPSPVSPSPRSGNSTHQRQQRKTKVLYVEASTPDLRQQDHAAIDVPATPTSMSVVTPRRRRKGICGFKPFSLITSVIAGTLTLGTLAFIIYFVIQMTAAGANSDRDYATYEPPTETTCFAPFENEKLTMVKLPNCDGYAVYDAAMGEVVRLEGNFFHRFEAKTRNIGPGENGEVTHETLVITASPDQPAQARRYSLSVADIMGDPFSTMDVGSLTSAGFSAGAWRYAPTKQSSKSYAIVDDREDHRGFWMDGGHGVIQEINTKRLSICAANDNLNGLLRAIMASLAVVANENENAFVSPCYSRQADKEVKEKED